MKLIKEYTEGLKVYKCSGCGREINIRKAIPKGEAQCTYCGTREDGKQWKIKE